MVQLPIFKYHFKSIIFFFFYRKKEVYVVPTTIIILLYVYCMMLSICIQLIIIKPPFVIYVCFFFYYYYSKQLAFLYYITIYYVAFGFFIKNIYIRNFNERFSAVFWPVFDIRVVLCGRGNWLFRGATTTVVSTTAGEMKSNKAHIHVKWSEPFVYSLLIKLSTCISIPFRDYVIRSTSIT